jgi:hypothetical protein
MQDVSESEREQDAGASAARHRTWTRLPALRIGGRAQWRVRKGAHTGEATPATRAAHALSPPRLLRLWRASIGLALLALGCGLAMLSAVVFDVIWRPLPRHGVAQAVALRVLGAAGLGFLVVIALSCIVTAAFALSLAITQKEW